MTRARERAARAKAGQLAAHRHAEDLHEEAANLQQVLRLAKTLLDADRAGLKLVDQTGALRCAGGSDRVVEAGAGDLSVPVQVGGGPVGTLDVYLPGPSEGDDNAAALQAYAGWSRACSWPQRRRGPPAGWPTSCRRPWSTGR